ncbi:MAG: methyl-accepting chemotaxis protein [Aureispira sp.]
MKQPKKIVRPRMVSSSISQRIKEAVLYWQQTWQMDIKGMPTYLIEPWVVSAVLWIESVLQETVEKPTTSLFWEEWSRVPLTSSQWNIIILQLDNALDKERIPNKEKIIEAALEARQQYDFITQDKLLVDKAIAPNNKNASDITTQIIRNSNSIIMNEEKTNYQDLLQRMVDVSFCRVEFDQAGVITSINQNMIDLLRYDKIDDLVGENLSVIMDSNEELKNNTTFGESLTDGVVEQGDYCYLTKTGNRVWIQGSYSPLFNTEGEVTKIVNIAVDITKEREKLLSSQVLKAAIDDSFARIEYDIYGEIKDANNKFLSLFQYDSLDELVGQKHTIFLEKNYAESNEYKEFWDNLRKGESQNGDFKRLKKDGSEVWIQSIYAPVRNKKNDIERIIKIAINVTPQKQFLDEINKVIILAGEEGRLGARLDASKAAGDWKLLASSVNLLLESVALPVSELGEVVGALAQGDLAIRFDSFVEGDIKELGDELNSAISSIASLMAQIAQIGDLVAASAEEMLVKGEEMKNTTLEVASATQQMAEGAQQQAQQTDEASKMMDNVLLSVDVMAEKANKINESANIGQENSTKGLDIIQLVAENMGEIKESASSTSTSIETFAERSEEIARALSVITDIASQTNLLALNAAIEAARAGDAGRGFAVVAEEIRKLAEGSRRSAVDIEKVIREIHKDISAASKAIDYMERSVTSGIEASKKAESVFESIEEANKETLDLSNEIVAATEQQRASIHGTAKNIEKIVIVAEETASGTEQVASSSRVLSQGMNEVTATSEDLANVATQLQENISKFKLPE